MFLQEVEENKHIVKVDQEDTNEECTLKVKHYE